MAKRRSNKSVKRMMLEVARDKITNHGEALSDREFLVWYFGPCYVCGGNLIWICSGEISLTASELKG